MKKTFLLIAVAIVTALVLSCNSENEHEDGINTTTPTSTDQPPVLSPADTTAVKQ